MAAMLTQTVKNTPNAGKADDPLRRELGSIRDSLVKERQRLNLLLARTEKVLRAARPKKTPLRRRDEPSQDEPPVPGPFDQLSDVVGATEDLRASNGNLSADLVAKLYGVPMSRLAGWLGRSKQSLAKTPDADSLQEPLGFFERVARLRLVSSSNAAFRKWLRSPDPALDAKNPLELLATGRWQALADYVEDILTGTPG
jgi:hypothetical protein